MQAKRHILLDYKNSIILQFMSALILGASEAGFEEYLSARRAWNERYGSYIASAQRWRWVAFGVLGLSIIMAIGLIVLASQNRLIPYVIEVDGKARATAAYPASQIKTPNEHLIKAALMNWIVDWRTVTLDVELQKKALARVYSHFKDHSQTANKINDWYRLNNPFERALKELVHIDISSVLSASHRSWRVNWIEKYQDRQAIHPVIEKAFTALLTTEAGQLSADQLLLNPIGLFVYAIDWSQDKPLQGSQE